VKFGLTDLVDPRLQPLVPASRDFYRRRVAGRGPRDVEELRQARARTPVPTPSDPPAAVELLRAAGRSVPGRLHLPAGGGAAGVLLDVHGGGFYLGSAAANDRRNRLLADSLGVAVVSVDYRLAPEHPWPAAPDDCETAALWLAGHAACRPPASTWTCASTPPPRTGSPATRRRWRQRRWTTSRAGSPGTWRSGDADIRGR